MPSVDSSILLDAEVSDEVPMPTAGQLLELTDKISETLPPSKRGLSDKKRRGVFYTPDKAAQLLTEWSIRKSDDTVLEPSFGGCGFLESALEELTKLGASSPQKQLLGCDIDPVAFTHLTQLLGDTPEDAYFKQKDFLEVSPSDFAVNQVDAIIGNPPYVSWHNMLHEQRKSANAVNIPNGSSLSSKGSLWTFFLAHSLHFLKPGGRMAWILPGSFLYADYANNLRKSISQLFTHKLAIMLSQRLFVEAGTEESTIILLAEDYQPQSESAATLCFASVSTLAHVPEVINKWNSRELDEKVWGKGVGHLLIPDKVLQAYDLLNENDASHKLSDLARIRIGLVTGDNSFFVLTAQEAEKLNIPSESVRPVVTRQAHLTGLQVKHEDLETLKQKKAKCLLINTEHQEMSPELITYINTYPAADLKGNRTFSKREPWYRIVQEKTPDAFFSCMNWYGPQLVLNSAATTCTNTVYRVEFLEPQKMTLSMRQALAISLQSTYSQLSAELSGRIYGTGALKLEPSDAKRIQVLLPTNDVASESVFNWLDELLRQGEAGEARQLADLFLIDQGLLTVETVEVLQSGLATLRNIRRGTRKPFVDQ